MKKLKRIAPKGKYRVICFDFFELAEYHVKDCRQLRQAKKLADKEDCVWSAARVYDSSGKERYATKTANVI